MTQSELMRYSETLMGISCENNMLDPNLHGIAWSCCQHLKSMWSLRMNSTQRRKELSDREVQVPFSNPLIQLYLKQMSCLLHLCEPTNYLVFLFVGWLIRFGFGCSLNLFEILRSHLFASNRKF